MRMRALSIIVAACVTTTYAGHPGWGSPPQKSHPPPVPYYPQPPPRQEGGPEQTIKPTERPGWGKAGMGNDGRYDTFKRSYGSQRQEGGPEQTIKPTEGWGISSSGSDEGYRLAKKSPVVKNEGWGSSSRGNDGGYALTRTYSQERYPPRRQEGGPEQTVKPTEGWGSTSSVKKTTIPKKEGWGWDGSSSGNENYGRYAVAYINPQQPQRQEGGPEQTVKPTEGWGSSSSGSDDGYKIAKKSSILKNDGWGWTSGNEGRYASAYTYPQKQEGGPEQTVKPTEGWGSTNRGNDDGYKIAKKSVLKNEGWGSSSSGSYGGYTSARTPLYESHPTRRQEGSPEQTVKPTDGWASTGGGGNDYVRKSAGWGGSSNSGGDSSSSRRHHGPATISLSRSREWTGERSSSYHNQRYSSQPLSNGPFQKSQNQRNQEYMSAPNIPTPENVRYPPVAPTLPTPQYEALENLNLIGLAEPNGLYNGRGTPPLQTGAYVPEQLRASRQFATVEGRRRISGRDYDRRGSNYYRSQFSNIRASRSNLGSGNEYDYATAKKTLKEGWGSGWGGSNYDRLQF